MDVVSLSPPNVDLAKYDVGDIITTNTGSWIVDIAIGKKILTCLVEEHEDQLIEEFIVVEDPVETIAPKKKKAFKSVCAKYAKKKNVNHDSMDNMLGHEEYEQLPVIPPSNENSIIDPKTVNPIIESEKENPIIQPKKYKLKLKEPAQPQIIALPTLKDQPTKKKYCVTLKNKKV